MSWLRPLRLASAQLTERTAYASVPSMVGMKLLTPLRIPSFRRVWAGQLANVLGDYIFVVAIAVFLVQRSDYGLALGLILALVAAGGVGSVVVGGVLADRYRRSRVIITADVIRSIGLTVFLVVGPHAGLGILCVGGTVLGLGSGLYKPAYAALYPSLVSAEDLLSVNSLRVLTNRSAGIAGAALGGVVVAVSSARLALVLDLATFLVSILTLLGTNEAPRPRARQRQSGSLLLREAAAGLHYVRGQPWVLAVMLQGTVQVALVTAPVNVLLPLVMRNPHGAYGAAVTAEAVGALVGAWGAASWEIPHRGAVAMVGCSLQLAVTIAIALEATWWVFIPGAFVTGFGLAAFAVLWTTALQVSVPDSLRGRVFSLDVLTATAFSPVGYALSGVLAGALGATTLAIVSSAVLALSVVGALAVPGVVAFATVTTQPDTYGA